MSFEIGYLFETEHLNINDKIKVNRLETKSNFEILTILGHGSFGRVNHVKHVQTGDNYALKTLNVSCYEKNDLENEINLMIMLEHPHIIKYFGEFSYSCYIQCVLLELCELGDLRNFINNKSFKDGSSTEKYRKSNQIKLEWSIELFEGLTYMHSKHIVHRDINPNNIFLFFNEQKNSVSIKIGDLGHSKEIKDYLKSWVGTPFFQSPELIANQAYNQKTDVWSAGCTIYELIRFVKPFKIQFSFDEAVVPIDEFELISDVVLFGMLEIDYKMRKNSEEILAELNIVKTDPSKRTIKRPGKSNENYIEQKEIYTIMKLSQELDDSVKFINRDCFKALLERKLFYVKSSNIYFTKLHIQQMLRKRRILTFKMDVFERNQNKIREFLSKDQETVLVLECSKKLDKNSKFLKEFDFNQLQNYHVIIIGSNENYDNFFFEFYLEIIENNKEYTFNDLTEETQNQLLDSRTVRFQGKRILLKKLIKNEFFKDLKLKNLKKLLKNKEDLEFSQKTKFDVEDFSSYYIQRQFKRFIQIDRKILENANNNDFLIVHTEEDFEEKCREQSKKSIHFLKKENDNQNLIWQKSKGPISVLNEYFIRNESCCVTIDENNILNENANILIISADPGMGKSTILEKIIQDSNSEHFLIKIVLNNFTKILKQIKENKIRLQDHNILDFILKSLIECKNELEMSLLKHLFHENRLFLMFDGVDEVSDYKEQVKFLIKALNENHKLNKIFITTRNNLKEDLENFFEIIAYNLNDFEVKDQQDFLVKYWHNLNGNLDENMLKNEAKALLSKLQSSLTENINKLIGIPLQTRMIAEIYYEIYLNSVNTSENILEFKINNIADLYHEFIERKFNILFEQKYKYEISQDENDYEERKKKFYADHIKYSRSILFENKNASDIIANELEENRILKYGLIVNFKNKTPVFLHQSYAEYFVALNAHFKINHKKDHDKEFEKIIKKDENMLIRKFLDNFIDKDENFKVNVKFSEAKAGSVLRQLILKIKNKILKRDYKKELENCCKENLYYLLKYLLGKKQANIKGPGQFLIVAADNGHKKIVELLLDKGIDINQKSEYWKRNALHVASEKGHKEIVELLIEKRIDINCQDIDGSNALHLAFLNEKKEIVKILIEKGINIHQQNNYGRNALHCASKSNYKDVVELLLEKDLDINLKDYDKRNALQWACVRGRKATVELLIEKGIEINEMDKFGDNALNLALKNGHKEIAKFLVEKEINVYSKNKEGKNALNLASEYGDNDLIELLKLKNFL